MGTLLQLAVLSTLWVFFGVLLGRFEKASNDKATHETPVTPELSVVG